MSFWASAKNPVHFILSSWKRSLKDLRCLTRHSERSEESWVHYLRSLLKSFHSLLSSSINAIFLSLFHHFITFSNSIASIIVGNSWNHTNLWIQYFFVNHSNIPCLCWEILCSILLVTQVYKTHHFLDANMYTYHFFSINNFIYKVNTQDSSLHFIPFRMTVFCHSERSEES